MSQEIQHVMTQPEVKPEIKLETKSNETNLNPVRARSQKQIEWSRELGKKSQELKT
jgi:hypothetical protein